MKPTAALRALPLVTVALLVGGAIPACAGARPGEESEPGCFPAMARIEASSAAPRAYCIDRFEASLVEVTATGEKPFSPYEPVKGRNVKAVSRGGVVPQAYISRNEADVACRAAKKRLCTEAEWVRACQGQRAATFPYGNERKTGYCNDNGKPPLATYYATMSHPAANEWDARNDARLNQQPESLSKTGSHPLCKSPYGVYDLMGNLHEWVVDPGGTFVGGYYLDTKLNGDGCHYKTVAHDASYHDYSTGFRCCADAR